MLSYVLQHATKPKICLVHQTVLKQATLSQLRDLRVILNQGGDNLTNADVVDAVKVIQQWTKRKSSNQEVYKFQRCKYIIMGVIVVTIMLLWQNL